MTNLVFLDIDGTILPSGVKQVPADNIKTINKIKANGDVPILCTGRNITSALSIIEQTGVDSYITSNGQQVTLKGECIHYSYFNVEQIDRITAIIKQHSEHMAIENKEGLNVEDTKVGRELLKLITGHGFVESKCVKQLPKTEVFQIWAFGTKETVDQVQASLNGVAELYRWGDLALEIAPLNSGKGAAIEIVQNQYTSPIKTYGFGDGVNDFSMMKVVDVSVAMGNANEKLQAYCDYVTSDCDKLGVEKALIKYGVLK